MRRMRPAHFGTYLKIRFQHRLLRIRSQDLHDRLVPTPLNQKTDRTTTRCFSNVEKSPTVLECLDESGLFFGAPFNGHSSLVEARQNRHYVLVAQRL